MNHKLNRISDSGDKDINLLSVMTKGMKAHKGQGGTHFTSTPKSRALVAKRK